MLRESKYI